jgi:hypothetical protein
MIRDRVRKIHVKVFLPGKWIDRFRDQPHSGYMDISRHQDK